MVMISIVILISLTTIGFGIFAMFEGIRDREMFSIFIGLILISAIVVPVLAVMHDTHQVNNSTLKTDEVTLTISDKTHNSARTQIIPSGKTSTMIHHPESWNITITDGENTQTIDNETLYNALNEGDKIEGYRDTYIKKDNSIYKVELRIKTN